MSAPGDAVTTARWRITSASARGSAHRGRSPNQDAVRTLLARGGDGGPVWVAAVSDGHGGPRYVRSDLGSREAVDVAVERVARAVARSSAGADPVGLLRQVVPEIVAEWARRVDAHYASHPFTPAEVERSGHPEPDVEPRVAYGATLLVVLVADGAVAAAQIGDGDVLVRAGGQAARPVPDDTRLVAGETTSLCLDGAVADFRFALVPDAAEVDLVVVATDGYGNSFAERSWWSGLVADLAGFVHRHGFDELGSRFPGWLDESAAVGGDDVTAVVLARDPLVVAPGASTATSGRPPAQVLSSPAGVTSALHPAEVAATGARARTLPLETVPAHPVPAPAGVPRRRAPWIAAAFASVAALAMALTVLVVLGTRDEAGIPESPATTPTSVPDRLPGREIPLDQPRGGGRDDGPDRPPSGDREEPSRIGGGSPPPDDGGPIGQGP